MIAPVVHTTVDEAALVASICNESFFEFVKEFWHVVVPEKPVWNWHIPYLCDEFQKDAERVFAGLPRLHDTVCNVPPGTTKSTILSVMAPAWIHARMPSARVIAASHTQTLTLELGRRSRMIEQSPLYRAAWPAVVPAPDQNTKTLYMNTANGGRMAATVGGTSPVGFHAHFLLVDDPIDPQQARSLTGADLETANAFMTETLPSRKVDKEVTVTWLVQQRLHQNDPSGFLLSNYGDDIRHICLPATRSRHVRPRNVRKHYKDRLLDPVRMPRSVLEDARRRLGVFGYAGQFDQHPVPRGGGMFKPDRIIVGTPPLFRHRGWVCFCRFWDKAGTQGGGAFTVGLLMGRFRPDGAPSDGSEDQWWVLDVVRGQWDAGEREQVIVATARRDGPGVVIGLEQEPGSGGKESAQLSARRLAGYQVRIMPAVGTKEDRADSWASLVNMGCFYIPDGPSWVPIFVDELRYFPFSTYRDQVDAGSGAFAVCSVGRRRIGAL